MSEILIRGLIILSVLVLVGVFFYYLWQFIVTCSILGIQFDQTPDGLFTYCRVNF